MRSPRFIIVLAVLAYATGLSVVLAFDNRDLRNRNADLLRAARIPNVGMYVPGTMTSTIGSQEVLLGRPPDGTRQLLLVFDTHCEYCLASLAAWRALRDALADEPDIEIFGLSLDPEAETAIYSAEHDLGFSVVSVPDRPTKSMYRLGAVPLIVILETEGLVRYARLGQLTTQAAVDSVLLAARTTPDVAAAPAGRSVYPSGESAPGNPSNPRRQP